MVFTKRLRPGVRSGRIRCSIRIWTHPHVKVGGRYPMEDGHIVVDSIAPMRRSKITTALARESGFRSVADLLEMAEHGAGKNVYLIRFHYLPAGAWDERGPVEQDSSRPAKAPTLLQRIKKVKVSRTRR